jgi:hypothetical protein
MYVVRRTIHIRTGQGAQSEAVDAWLSRHDVEVAGFADVYAACAYLLKHCDCVPDLVLVGADWLSASEFDIVRYARETWPHVGIVVYGGAQDAPSFEHWPRVRTCRSTAALKALLAGTPTDVLDKMPEEISPAVVPARGQPQSPRYGSTAEQLSALLEGPDDG